MFIDKMDVDRRQRVLIVDDVRLNTIVLANSLKDEYEVTTALSGREAIEIARSNARPDIILLDIVMPDLDGYEVCKILQQDEKTHDIPIIFLTALEGHDDEVYGLELGAIDFIRKPFKVHIVKAKIRNHLERKRYQDLLERDSRIDKLTRIANRRRFDEVFYEESQRAIRIGHQVAVLMIDVDCFKAYNDRFGHIKGDEALQQVATALRQNLLRSSDLVARWGGEEFMCLLPDTDYKGAQIVAERLRTAVLDLKIVNDDYRPEEYLSVSIGVAVSDPDDITSFSDLVNRADAALYEAKEYGRNCVVSCGT